ncbi:MAG: hypothetical protein ACI81R_001884 [Bradymonadia bacterium]|jgi:hypothetical protein
MARRTVADAALSAWLVFLLCAALAPVSASAQDEAVDWGDVVEEGSGAADPLDDAAEDAWDWGENATDDAIDDAADGVETADDAADAAAEESWDWGDEAGDENAGGDDSWDWGEGDTDSDDDFDWDAVDDAIEAETENAADDAAEEATQDEINGNGDETNGTETVDGAEEETDWNSYWNQDEPVEADNIEVPVEVAADDSGVQGIVTDNDFREPIAGATVSVDETDEELTTGPNGVFFFLLDPGIYTLRFDHFDYDGSAYQVEVESGDITEMTDVRLRTEETVITVVTEGRAIEGSVATQLMERQESTTVQDAIGEEQFSRSADGSASSAVRRVVGVTIEDGRFLVVRGLSGRYNLVTLNGVPVPKTDPDYPSAELDIFPTDLLSNITLMKNPSADQFGGFVGGLMDIETRSYPEELELSLGIGISGTSQATFQRYRLFEGGGTDFLGFNGGNRGLPDSLPANETLSQSRTSTLTPEEFEAIAEDFPEDWSPTRRTAIPNFGFEGSIGNTLETSSGREIGYLLSATYSHAQTTSERMRGSVQLRNGETERRSRLAGESYQDVIKWGALGNLSFELGDGHDLRVVSLFNQNARDSFQDLRGDDGENGNGASRQSRIWRQRSLSFNQLLGRHRRLLPESSPWHETRVDWSAAFSWARRYEPANQYFTSIDGDWDDNPGSGEFFSSELDQTDAFARIQLEMPYRDSLILRTGGDVLRSARGYESRRLRYTKNDRNADPSLFSTPPGQLFTDANVGAPSSGALLTMQEQPLTGDAYSSEQLSIGGFGQFELVLSERIRWSAGLRAEVFRQDIEAIDIAGDPEEGEGGRRTDVDYLPSTSVVAELTDDLYLRLVYGRSVARPQVREVAPFVFQDYPRRRTVSGNPDLIRELVDNVDARLEWFPSASEVLAATFFLKRYQHPIEAFSDRQGAVTYQNAEGALDFGAEFEVQLELENLADPLDGWLFSTNVSLVRSRIELRCDDENDDGDCDQQYTTTERRRIGQAPWMVNSSLGWEQPGDARWSVFAFYNVIGPRLETAGTNGLPNSQIEPFHSLDLTASYRFAADWKLKLGLENVAFQRRRETQGGLGVASDYEGLEAGLSLSWSPR